MCVCVCVCSMRTHVFFQMPEDEHARAQLFLVVAAVSRKTARLRHPVTWASVTPGHFAATPRMPGPVPRLRCSFPVPAASYFSFFAPWPAVGAFKAEC